MGGGPASHHVAHGVAGGEERERGADDRAQRHVHRASHRPEDDAAQHGERRRGNEAQLGDGIAGRTSRLHHRRSAPGVRSEGDEDGKPHRRLNASQAPNRRLTRGVSRVRL